VPDDVVDVKKNAEGRVPAGGAAVLADGAPAKEGVTSKPAVLGAATTQLSIAKAVAVNDNEVRANTTQKGTWLFENCWYPTNPKTFDIIVSICALQTLAHQACLSSTVPHGVVSFMCFFLI